MKDVAFGIVIMMGLGFIMVLSMVQMALSNLHTILMITFLMGVFISFVTTMLVFNYQDFDFTLLL